MVPKRDTIPMFRQAANAPAEKDLTQAVRRVYERYGDDLKAFFRDVKEKVELERPSSAPVDPASRHGDESAA